MNRHGWLFVVSALQNVMVVWLHQDDGTVRRLENAFHPWLYAHAPRDDLRTLAMAALRTGICSIAVDARAEILEW